MRWRLLIRILIERSAAVAMLSPGVGMLAVAVVFATVPVCVRAQDVVEGVSVERADGDGEVDLQSLLKEYFSGVDVAESVRLEGEIHAAVKGSVSDVLDAMLRMVLWEPVSPGLHTFDFAGFPDCVVHVPEGYDPKVPHPVTIAILPADPGGVSPHAMRELASHIVCMPRSFDRVTFHSRGDRVEEIRALLAALRRRFSVDGERVYLYGRGVGGDSAWMVSLFAADLFAGVWVDEGALSVPYRRAWQPLLLENLRRTPVHLRWTNVAMPVGEVLSGRAVGVSLANWSVVDMAERMGLMLTWCVRDGAGVAGDSVARDSVTGDSEGGDVGAGDVGASESDIDVLLNGRRSVLGSEVSRWFRDVEQGRCGWLRAGAMREPEWVGDQVDVLAGRGGDRYEVARVLFRERMGYLSGRIVGQRIEVESRRCEFVELHLPFGSVDFSKPVTIYYHGKRRFGGRLMPTVRTVLRSAREAWAFEGAACVRLRMGRRGRVVPF